MIRNEGAVHGINHSKLDFDVSVMMSRKEKVVGDLANGIDYLFQKHSVDRVTGFGRITSHTEVTVSKNDGSERVLRAKNILIATGSTSTNLPDIDIDDDKVISSTGALSLDKIPKSMIVIGGGVIGLELGTVWNRLGAQITVIEAMDEVLPGTDTDAAKNLRLALEEQGIQFRLKVKAVALKKTKNTVSLTVEPLDGADKEELKAEKVLIAIGRSPVIPELGNDISIDVDQWGFVKVDSDYQTSIPGVYAIGDVIGGQMLAHKAEEEGIAVVDYLAGKYSHVNYKTIPSVVYTHPELAGVGETEQSLKDAGKQYKMGRFPFMANSRARCNGDTKGFVKILSDKESDRILGAHIIGPNAGELIQEIVAAMEFDGTTEDIQRICHAHPGVFEAVREAALNADRMALHI